MIEPEFKVRLFASVSVPLAVPYAALEMRKRGHTADAVDKLVYQNPITFLSQSPKFKI